MKRMVCVLFVSLLVFTSCKKEVNNPVNTNMVPAPPILLLPTDGAESQSTSPILRWEASKNATSYILSLATIKSFPDSSLVISGNIGDSTMKHLSGLRNSITYYWKVAAVNNYGTSEWSRVSSFSTGYPPPTPILVMPLNEAIDISTSPSLTWNASINVTSYSLQVSTNDLFFVGLVYNKKDLVNTIETVTDLTKSKKYFWRVRASNSFGNSGWSEIYSFTTFNSCSGVHIVEYEGKTYNTVEIGNQCWLKENLNVGTMIPVVTPMKNDGIIEKFCLDNNPANCDTFGGFYEWNEAMTYSTLSRTKGICPNGWHLPTIEEYETLEKTVKNNSDALKAVGQGSGTNTSGFSALLAGRCFQWYFGLFGLSTQFLTSTEWNTGYSEVMILSISDKRFYYMDIPNDEASSIRCLKN